MDSTGKYKHESFLSVAVQLDHQQTKVHLLKNGPKSLQNNNPAEFTVIKLIYHFDNCSLFLWML